MKINKLLFVIIVLFFFINFLIIVGNNGLEVEVGGSIDVHHHVWFTKYTIINGHFPHDQAYEYMPNSLILTVILSVITNSEALPLVISIRNLSNSIAYIIFTFILLKMNAGIPRKRLDQLILILLITLPTSFGLIPLFLSINVFPCLIFAFLYVASKLPRGIISINWTILYLVLMVSMLLSNFSYTLIILVLIYTPFLIKTICFRNRLSLRSTVSASLANIENIYNPMLTFNTFTIVLFYIIYVIMGLGTSYMVGISSFLERLANLLIGSGEIAIIKTRAISLLDAIVVGFKIWGFLAVPFGLMTLISMIDLLIGRRGYANTNANDKSIDCVSLFTLLSLFIVGLTPWLGYDTLRLVNVSNLFVALHCAKVLKRLGHPIGNMNRAKVFKTVFRAFILVIITLSYFTSITYMLPQGYVVLNPEISVKTPVDNNIIIELVRSVEYFSPPLKFYASTKLITNFIQDERSVLCDRSVCHTFMYLDRRDLYLRSRSISDTIAYDPKLLDGATFTNEIEDNVFVLVNSEPGKILTEEPIEYRALSFRLWLLNRSKILFYNSGVICGFVW